MILSRTSQFPCSVSAMIDEQLVIMGWQSESNKVAPRTSITCCGDHGRKKAAYEEDACFDLIENIILK